VSKGALPNVKILSRNLDILDDFAQNGRSFPKWKRSCKWRIPFKNMPYYNILKKSAHLYSLHIRLDRPVTEHLVGQRVGVQ